MREMTEEGKAFIKRREACILTPHWDAIGQVFDIGYGHVLKPGEPRVAITQDEAEALFDIDVHYYSDAVDQAVTVDISPPMMDALSSLAYNAGTDAFRKSSVLAYVNAEMHQDACIAMLMYRVSKGAYVPGLLLRRAAEVVMYAEGVYL